MTDLRISAMLGAGGTMKPLVKLLTDFITWRWAPAVGLLAASMIYVIVVVGLVPSEIGVPVANAKFESQSRTASGSLFGGTSTATDTNENSYGSTPGETRPVSAPPRPIMRAPAADFGKRGFSPRLDRPEPPSPAAPPLPTPAAPPTTVAPAVTRGTFGGLFSRIQGALRPGSPAAQSLAEAAQARAQQVATPPSTAPAAPSAAEPAPAPAPPPPNAPPPNPPAEAAPQPPPPPEAPQQPAPADSAAPAAPSAEPPAQ